MKRLSGSVWSRLFFLLKYPEKKEDKQLTNKIHEQDPEEEIRKKAETLDKLVEELSNSDNLTRALDITVTILYEAGYLK